MVVNLNAVLRSAPGAGASPLRCAQAREASICLPSLRLQNGWGPCLERHEPGIEHLTAESKQTSVEEATEVQGARTYEKETGGLRGNEELWCGGEDG